MAYKIKSKLKKLARPQEVYFKDAKTGVIYVVDKKTAKEFEDSYPYPQNLIYLKKIKK